MVSICFKRPPKNYHLFSCLSVIWSFYQNVRETTAAKKLFMFTFLAAVVFLTVAFFLGDSFAGDLRFFAGLVSSSVVVSLLAAFRL